MSTLNKISLNGVSYDIGTGTFFVGPTSSENPFVLEGHAPGIYVFENGLPYIKRLNTDTGYWRNALEDCRINLIATPTSSTEDGTILFTYLSGEHGNVPTIGSSNASSSGSGGLASFGSISGVRTITYLQGNQTVNGKKTFSTLPESSVVPTTNNQLVNKKYVDDSTDGLIPYYDSGYYMTPTRWTVVGELPDYPNSTTLYFVSPDYYEQYINTSVSSTGFNSGVSFSHITNYFLNPDDLNDIKETWQNTAPSGASSGSENTRWLVHAPKYEVAVGATPVFTNTNSEDLHMYGVLEQRNPQTTALIYSAYLDVDANLTSGTMYYYDHDDYHGTGTGVPIPIYIPGSTSFYYTIGTNGGLACLKGDTPIKTGNARTKQIKDLAVGDTVIDAAGNKTKVVKVFSHTVNTTFNITLSNEDVLVASYGHKFSINNHFRKACQMLKDHKLDRQDGSKFDVVATEIKQEEMEVYEILTESGTYTLGNGIICECEAI